METNHDNATARRNGATLVSAALAAGTVSGVASLLNEARRRGRDISDRASDRVTSTVDERSPELQRRLGDAVGSARDQIGQLQATGRAQAERLGAHVSERASDLADQAKLRPRLEQAREQVEGVVADAVERGKRIVPERAPDLEQLAQKHVLPAIHESRDRVLPLLNDSRERVLPKISETRDRVLPLLSESRERVLPLLNESREHVLPKVNESRERMLAVADDVLATATDLGKRATDQFAADAKKTAEEAGKRFSESLTHAEKSLSHLRGGATSIVDDVEANTALVARNAAKGSQNAAATVLWVGAAGAVVYLGLLKPEQRAKVRAFASRSLDEAKALYRDIRGHDGSFPDAGTTSA